MVNCASMRRLVLFDGWFQCPAKKLISGDSERSSTSIARKGSDPMKQSGFVCAGLLALLLTGVMAQENKHNYLPPNGCVPDAKTATAIAVAVWTPIYGEKSIAGEKPYKAHLQNGVWTVEGSLPERHPGGVAVAEISKKDGRILRISHGR